MKFFIAIFLLSLYARPIAASTDGYASIAFIKGIDTTQYASTDKLSLRMGVSLFNTTKGLLSLGIYKGSGLIGTELSYRRILNTGIYLGSRIGLGIVAASHASLRGIQAVGTAFAWSPFVGYGFPLNDSFKILTEASLLSIESATLKHNEKPLAIAPAQAYPIFQVGFAYLW